MSTLLPVSLQLSLKRACQMQSQQRWTALNGVANLLMLLHHCSPTLTLLIFSLLQKSSSNIISDILAPVYLRHSISDFNLANPSNFHTSRTCLQVAGPGHLEGSGMEQLEPAHQSRTFQPEKAQKPAGHLVNDRVNQAARNGTHPVDTAQSRIGLIRNLAHGQGQRHCSTHAPTHDNNVRGCHLQDLGAKKLLSY